MAGKFEMNRNRTFEEVHERANQRGSAADTWLKQGINVFKSKEGLNTLRYLPVPKADADRLGLSHYGMEVFVHYNVGGDRHSYPCLEAMKKQRCPVCEYRKQLEAEKADEEEIKELRYRKTVIAWVIDRDAERTGVQLWPMSYTMDKKFCALSMDERDKTILIIDDPDEGYDISFRREGTGLNTKYNGEKIAREPSYLMRDERDQEDLLQFVAENPLDSVIQFFSEEEIDATLNGRSTANEDRGRIRDDRESDRGRDRADDRGRGRGDEPRRLRDRLNDDDGGGRGEREGRSRDTGARDEPSDDRTRGRAGRGSDRDDDRGTRDRGDDSGRSDRGRDRNSDRDRPDDRRSGGADNDGAAEEATYEDDEGNLVNRETGEVLETASERGRAEANREPAERASRGRDEGPRGRSGEASTERRRPASRVADDPPPARSGRGSTREADEGVATTERRRPAASRDAAPSSAEQGKGRLAGLRGRR